MDAALSVTQASLWFPTLHPLRVEPARCLDDKSDLRGRVGHDMPRLGAAGLMLAAYATTLTLRGASFTARRAYAAVATPRSVRHRRDRRRIGAGDFSGGIADVVTLANLPQAVLEAVRWTFGDERSPDPTCPFDALAAVRWRALTVELGAT